MFSKIVLCVCLIIVVCLAWFAFIGLICWLTDEKHYPPDDPYL